MFEQKLLYILKEYFKVPKRYIYILKKSTNNFILAFPLPLTSDTISKRLKTKFPTLFDNNHGKIKHFEATFILKNNSTPEYQDL